MIKPATHRPENDQQLDVELEVPSLAALTGNPRTGTLPVAVTDDNDPLICHLIPIKA